MGQKQVDNQDSVKKSLELFLKAKQDEHSVAAVEQELELHVVGTTAYIPSYTRGVMDRSFGAPVMAVHTRTETESKTVFIYPAKDPNARGARRLRSTETMGPALLAFGVPLRKLKLKLSVTRRIVLQLHALEVPNEGTVYWASFADVEKERRDIDVQAIAAARQEKAAQKKSRKAARSRKAGAGPTPEQG